MKVSLNWLKDFVDIDASADDIAHRLTFSGTEVESVTRVGSGYEDIVAGRVLEIKPHPDADKLVLCEVDSGEGQVEVVCGARNFGPGDMVPLAKVGSKLPSGLKIKARKVRGVESQGMLCAEDELDISDDHSGIMLLPPDVEPGTGLAKIVGGPDVVFEMEVTWNRPDCLSVAGIARELAALYKVPLKQPDTDLTESGEMADDLVKVSIDDPGRCPRYTARVLRNVNVRQSPVWMRRRLSSCGIRPINNVVDITNYVLLEWGQPLHAFDYGRLNDRNIVVRAAGPGESIRTLDGNDRKLDSDILVIADKQRPLAVAGVMGGEETEINGQTGSILLESACFAPADIRFTSAKLGVTTESSYRFERGVDMDNVERAGRRAAKLMVEYADALPAAGVVDNYPGKSAPRRAGCRYSRVNKVLGAEVPAEEIASIFESLGMPVDDESEDRCEVTVPSFRKDIVIEADLIEEVARIHGLDSIPAGDPNARIVPGADDAEWMKTGQCRSVMAGLGFDEIANYSTASGLLLDKASPENPDNRLYLPNPVSSDHDVLRDSLAPQMLDTLGRNHARQVEDAALFEIGRVFGTSDGKDFEEDRISIGLMGTPGGRRYGMDARPDGEQTFLAAKGAIEELCCTLHAGPLSLRTEHRRCLDESASLSLFLDGRKAGFIGLAAPELLREWRIEKPVAIAELELEPLKKNAFSKPSPLPVPQYPAVSRDMALVVDDSVLNGDIERIIWENAPAELTSVRLFDIFTDEGRIGSGRKSVAYTLSYRSSERTLTDEDANRYHEDVKAALKRELKAEVREG